MKVEKKELDKSQLEINVELSIEEFKPFIVKGTEAVAKDIKIEGFRPGKAPYEMIKQKIGEMTILEEAARLAINKTLDKVFKDYVDEQVVGQPKVDVTKLAPDNPMAYKVVVALIPEINLGEYKNLKIKQKKTVLKDEDVNKTLSELQEMRVQEKIVDRDIKDKDKTVVDIQMFLDKVPVEGGQSKDTAVIIGKNYIVPGFGKKLIGAKKGDIREFSLPYPKEHHMKNLAGKMVDFKVTIKEVYERVLPELDDKFALGFGLKKIDELKENIKKSMTTQRAQEEAQKAERTVLEELIKKSKIGDIPETLIESESRNMILELEQTVKQKGGKFDDYLQSIGKTQEQLQIDVMPEAVKRVKASLIIREIAIKEAVKVKPEEVEDHIKHMKEHYKDKKELWPRFETEDYKNYIINTLTSRKVADKLREWNIQVEK